MSEIEYARGIDVSEWQGEIDWPKVAASGVRFAFIRATVGRADNSVAKDKHFDRNWHEAKNAGLLRGAYHYLGASAWNQAKAFAAAVGGDRPELGYWLDVEAAGLTADKVTVALEAIDRLSGETCHVYTSKSRWPSGVSSVAGRKLWVAHWTMEQPALPSAWKDWEFWQYSNRGTVPGISGRVDLDWYRAGPDKLLAEYGPPGPPEPPAPEIDVDTAAERIYEAMDQLLAALDALGRPQ